MSEKPRLLVVDDEPVVGVSCKAIFERQGFAVEATTSPVEGLEKVRKTRYAAILLDIMMPEMNGLEFLERLRTFNVTVPVVIITGYSSVTSAAEAMRLHASDYIPKPFTPDEITAAVRRVLAMPDEAAATAAPAESWTPDGGCLFLDHAWMRRGRDGTVRAGAFLPRADAGSVVAVHLPAPGVRVYEGLPLGEVVLADGRRRPIPSPVHGEILEVNRALAAAPTTGWEDPCGAAWLARVRPELGEAAGLAAPRRTVVVARDAKRTEALRAALERLGCEVQPAADATAAVAALEAVPGSALVLDGGSFDAAAPGLLDAVQAAVPEARIVVVAPNDWKHQAACRTRRVFYYAVEPVADDEWIDVLDGTFRAPPPVPPPAPKGPLPDALRMVRLTNRHGTAVALLAPDAVLFESTGVGRMLLEGLRRMAVPARLTMGSEKLTTVDIWELAQGCERGFLLLPQDGGRTPGSILRESTRSPWTPEGAGEDRIATFIVQAAPEGPPLDFDPRTNDALARLLLARMAAARR
ncbi:MAG: response regulator [Deltaproteobacteria bacterium]|nr:response regulator [Deltaproteobacteria bacterium]